MPNLSQNMAPLGIAALEDKIVQKLPATKESPRTVQRGGRYRCSPWVLSKPKRSALPFRSLSKLETEGRLAYRSFQFAEERSIGEAHRKFLF